MQRIGFVIHVKPDRLDEYKRQHANVWPELLQELSRAGMRNYSLFLREDGLEFGYLECENWERACKYLETSEVHTRWQEFMQDYLDTPPDGAGGQPIQMLEQVFFLP